MERGVEVEYRVNLVARAKRIFELILKNQTVKCGKARDDARSSDCYTFYCTKK